METKEPVIIFGSTKSHHHSHNTNVTITENRAPTDDSLRILDEMHEKVLNRILQHFKVSNSILDIDVVIYQTPSSDARYQVRSKFNINSNEYTVKTEISYHDYRKLETQAVIEGDLSKNLLIRRIFDDFSKKVSALICQELFQTEFFKQF